MNEYNMQVLTTRGLKERSNWRIEKLKYERINKWKNGQNKQWRDKHMGKRTNEWIENHERKNDRSNEQIIISIKVHIINDGCEFLWLVDVQSNCPQIA